MKNFNSKLLCALLLVVSSYGWSQTAVKRIVGEEATGTWCGWCVRGIVYMDQMATDHPDTWIGIAVHNSDPMVLAAYNTGATTFPGFTGFPSVIVDRYQIKDPSGLPGYYSIHYDDETTVDFWISGGYDDATRTLTATVHTIMFGDLTDIDYNLHLVLTEDGVSGNGTSWAQHNYYSYATYGTGSGAMGGFENLSDPVPATDMVYDHVARYLADGWAGTAGVIPTSVANGDVYDYTYTIPIDEDWDYNNINVIAFVTDLNTPNDKIINGYQTRLTSITGVKDAIAGVNDVDIFPNPANTISNIRINLTEPKNVIIRVSDINGHIVAEKNYGQLNGNVALPLHTENFASGIYSVNIFADGQYISDKIVVTH